MRQEQKGCTVEIPAVLIMSRFCPSGEQCRCVGNVGKKMVKLRYKYSNCPVQMDS